MASLFEEVLLGPVKEGCDELLVIGGYVSPAMAYRHYFGPIDFSEDGRKQTLHDLGVKLRLLYGMYPQEGLGQAELVAFREIQERSRGMVEVRLREERPPCHIKAYIWCFESVPQRAFVGSANYSQNAFDGRLLEILRPSEPTHLASECEQLWETATPCEGITEITHQRQRSIIRLSPSTDGNRVVLKLTVGKGSSERVPASSGLNWSFRSVGKPTAWVRQNPDQAYITVPTTVCNRGFFPPRGSVFLIQTDDGQVFECVTAQGKVKGASPERYGAIETFRDNSLLGRYFRERVGMAIKENLRGKPVLVEHLRRYGRTTVEFEKVSDELYYMDFSRPGSR